MNALTEFSRLSGSLFIDGAVRTSDTTERLDIIDPATEDRIGEMSDATEAEVDEAIAIANHAQKTWDAKNPLHRAELMHECGRKMAEITPMVSEMMTREMGKPYKESADELQWGISAIDYFAEITRHEAGKVLGPVTDGQFHFTQKSAMGTAVIILPFNFPIVLFCWEAAPTISPTCRHPGRTSSTCPSRASGRLPPLAPICTSATHERLVHAYGKSFIDAARLLAREAPHSPDIVAYPAGEAE